MPKPGTCLSGGKRFLTVGLRFWLILSGPSRPKVAKPSITESYCQQNTIMLYLILKTVKKFSVISISRSHSTGKESFYAPPSLSARLKPIFLFKHSLAIHLHLLTKTVCRLKAYLQNFYISFKTGSTNLSENFKNPNRSWPLICSKPLHWIIAWTCKKPY